MLRELPEQLQRDVRDDLDVNPGVVVHVEPRDGIHVRDMPPGLDLVVRFDPLEQSPELSIATRGDAEVHRGDSLRRAEQGRVRTLERE